MAESSSGEAPVDDPTLKRDPNARFDLIALIAI